MPNNEPLAADSDDDMTSIASANTPEAEEGESEDHTADGLRKRQCEVEERTADSEEKTESGNQDATESEMQAIAAAPLRSLPPLPSKRLRADVGCLAPTRLLNLADE